MGLLALSNIWASGSTFVLFALAARSLPTGEVGRFALVLSLVQGAVLLADAGLSQLLVRESARRSGDGHLKWALRQRTGVLLAIVALAMPMAWKQFGPTELLLASIWACMSSWHSACLLHHQAKGRIDSVVRLQLCNGAFFVAFSLLAARAATTVAFLAVGAMAYLLLLLLQARAIGRALAIRGFPSPTWRDQTSFIVIALLNAVTSTIDSLFAARYGATAMASYAAAQRPALAAAALNNAITGIVLPRMAVESGAGALAARRAVATYPVAVVLGGVIGFFGQPLATLAYGEELGFRTVFVFIFAAFTGGICTAIIGSSLIVQGRLKVMVAAALCQAVATALFAILLSPWGIEGVALGVLVGRIAGFIVLAWKTWASVDRA